MERSYAIGLLSLTLACGTSGPSNDAGGSTDSGSGTNTGSVSNSGSGGSSTVGSSNSVGSGSGGSTSSTTTSSGSGGSAGGYKCGWKKNDPGDLKMTGKTAGSVIGDMQLIDQCGETLSLWDLAATPKSPAPKPAEYYILFMTAAW